MLARRRVKLVAPSPSGQIYLDLAARSAPGRHYGHSAWHLVRLVDRSTAGVFSRRPTRHCRARRVAAGEGAAPLAAILPTIVEFADVLLLGTGPDGQSLADMGGVQVISRYDPRDLPMIMCEFQPHLGLLVSDFPETFSYTLDELFALAVPPVAIRIGALADRIRDGESGYLSENNYQAVVGLPNAPRARSRPAGVRSSCS